MRESSQPPPESAPLSRRPSVSLVPAEFVCTTGLTDAQCFVGWEELVPAGLDVAELATADVVGQMLDVNLDPRAVGWEQVDGHAPLFPDQAGLSALGNQLGLDHSLLRLAGLRIGIAHRQQHALRRLARLHLPCALSRDGDA